MFECERCDEDVERLLRHREYGVTVTHRVTRWLCHDCHPTAPATASTSKRGGSSERVATDGGTTV
jgi:hypothetical protein